MNRTLSPPTLAPSKKERGGPPKFSARPRPAPPPSGSSRRRRRPTPAARHNGQGRLPCRPAAPLSVERGGGGAPSTPPRRNHQREGAARRVPPPTPPPPTVPLARQAPACEVRARPGGVWGCPPTHPPTPRTPRRPPPPAAAPHPTGQQCVLQHGGTTGYIPPLWGRGGMGPRGSLAGAPHPTPPPSHDTLPSRRREGRGSDIWSRGGRGTRAGGARPWRPRHNPTPPFGGPPPPSPRPMKCRRPPAQAPPRPPARPHPRAHAPPTICRPPV